MPVVTQLVRDQANCDDQVLLDPRTPRLSYITSDRLIWARTPKGDVISYKLETRSATLRELWPPSHHSAVDCLPRDPVAVNLG